MPTTINLPAYQKLIAEDLAWLDQQPRTLERDHIADVLCWSAGQLYPLAPCERNDFIAAIGEAAWVRTKLGLPAAAATVDLYGAMHVMASHAHGYETYIVSHKCDDKQGEIARLTVEVEALKVENVRLQTEHALLQK